MLLFLGIMILSDRDIKKAVEEKEIVLDPFDPTMVQPASVDLRLGNRFLVFRNSSHDAIDVKKPIADLMDEVFIEGDQAFVLHPGDFVLGCTVEKVGLSARYVGQLNGKSSLGRIGIIVHATAGFIDPGNILRPTLELHNIGRLPVRLYANMPIAQISFLRLSSDAEEPYGSPKRKSKYYGSEGPEASKIHENF